MCARSAEGVDNVEHDNVLSLVARRRSFVDVVFGQGRTLQQLLNKSEEQVPGRNRTARGIRVER